MHTLHVHTFLRMNKFVELRLDLSELCLSFEASLVHLSGNYTGDTAVVAYTIETFSKVSVTL